MLKIISLILFSSLVKIYSITIGRSEITRNGFLKAEAMLLIDVN